MSITITWILSNWYKEGIKKVYDKDQKFVQLSYLYTIFNICQISNLILTLIVSKWSLKFFPQDEI